MLRHPVLVLGEFDGLHRGHRRVLAAAAEVAKLRRRPLAGLILHAADRPRVLTNVDDRVLSLLAAGASTCRVLRLTGPEIEAADIAEKILRSLHPDVIVAACAPSLPGTARYPDLIAALRASDRGVVEVERVANRGGIITSDRIRSAIETGDVSAASELLDRPYALSGVVQRGQQLGRTIGFPTANLAPPAGRTIPATGVYAASVILADGHCFDAAVNIGVRPTVDITGDLVIEAHLLDFAGELYDSRITVAFTHRIRGEHRFESLDALTDQLVRDAATVRQLRHL